MLNSIALTHPARTVLRLQGIAAALGATPTFSNGVDLEEAAALAAAADVAVVFVATLSHEGSDRTSLSLDDGCVPGVCVTPQRRQRGVILPSRSDTCQRVLSSRHMSGCCATQTPGPATTRRSPTRASTTRLQAQLKR